MKKIVLSLALFSLLLPTAGIAAEPAIGEIPASPEPAAETASAPELSTASGATPVAAAIPDLLPVAQPMSCSEVCGSYFAPNHEDCNDVACYGMGCGAPNGWDFSSGTCYCSYCF